MRRMTRKQKTYGGAERPLEVIVENVPISEIMVGRKRGREAKETLLDEVSEGTRGIKIPFGGGTYQPKYIRPGMKDLGSLNASKVSLQRTPLSLPTSTF